MSKLKKLLNATLIILLTIGCNQPTAIPIPQIPNQWRNQITVSLGSQFQLKVEQIAFIEAENLKIKFLNVDDSRCPTDIQCFWSGQVAIVVNVVKNERDLGNFKLISKVGNEKLSAKVFDGHSIRLIEVTPYPKTTQKIEVSDYIITLVVS